MLVRLALSMALLGWAATAGAAPLDLSLGVEGGVSRFSGPLGDAVKLGASWGVRAGVRATPWLSVGFSYAGSLNRLERAGEVAPPLLARDGATALARLSPGTLTLEPFVEIGLGVSRLTVTRGDAGPRYRGDTVLELPVAIGATLHTGVLDFGLRFGHVLLVGNQVYDGGGGHLSTGALTLGASF